jgi:hypothetical protein
MGKLKCICGEILSDTCGDDAYIFTDLEIEKIKADDGYVEYRGVLECYECGTLAIEDPIDSNSFLLYKPANGKYNKLFRA